MKFSLNVVLRQQKLDPLLLDRLSPKHVTLTMATITFIPTGRSLFSVIDITQAKRLSVDFIKASYMQNLWTPRSCKSHILFSALSYAVVTYFFYLLRRMFLAS